MNHQCWYSTLQKCEESKTSEWKFKQVKFLLNVAGTDACFLWTLPLVFFLNYHLGFFYRSDFKDKTKSKEDDLVSRIHVAYHISNKRCSRTKFWSKTITPLPWQHQTDRVVAKKTIAFISGGKDVGGCLSNICSHVVTKFVNGHFILQPHR